MAVVITDNGANMLAATRQLAQKYQLLALGCCAHSGVHDWKNVLLPSLSICPANLLLQDVCKLWDTQLAQCQTLEEYFRTSHHARALYVKEMNKRQGTLLVEACDTRWASKVDMLESCLTNRYVCPDFPYVKTVALQRKM